MCYLDSKTIVNYTWTQKKGKEGKEGGREGEDKSDGKKGNPGKELSGILDETALWTTLQIQFLAHFKAKIVLLFIHCCVSPWVTPS